MKTLHITEELFADLEQNNNRLHDLTIEMERVINWYLDHPHYQLDTEKVRKSMARAHALSEKIEELLKEAREIADSVDQEEPENRVTRQEADR
jgi:hypothetical protein